jgi:hypothetical protein
MKQKHNIIFLDHDGVLCLKNNCGSSYLTGKDYDDFDSICVKILNQIIEKTDAEIVVSSDWRLIDQDLLATQYHYKEMGITKEPIGFTPDLSGKSVTQNKAKLRAEEILQYIQKNEDEIETWVAIDDLELSLPKINFVKTNTEFGLNEPHIMQEVIEKINIKLL